MSTKTIKVDYLARVEGEGAFHVRIKDDKVVDAKLKLFEPPRYFEAFLRGRRYDEAPDITARICGICPVAYQMSSTHAMESLFGVKVDGALRELRRLLYCGEWIESHALHIYMLHTPDFLGYEDAIRMAKDHPGPVGKALKLKKIGNELMTIIGGREIHPINVRVGGFYRVPSKQELLSIREKLEWAKQTSIETIEFVATLPFPDFEQDYEFVCLRHPSEYPLCEGRIVSSKGIDVPVSEYENHFEEEHVKHSTSLQSHLVRKGTSYHVGPLARFNLNFDRLTPLAQEMALKVGLKPMVRNPFKSIVARAVELLWACEESLRIIDAYEPPADPVVEYKIKSGTGHGASEAPRGTLYHRYRIGSDGSILDAKIVPPTSQNQKVIEEDLAHFVQANLHLSKEQMTWQCEQVIRNYDPCISCSCHFLKLNLEQG